ncbi:M20 family metallopeptidase [Aerococcaceae bacterium WGS1372]
MTFEFIQEIENYKEPLIELRRELHQYPEASYQEIETSAYIERFLNNLEHANVTRPTETSVMAIFKGKKGQPKIGLRADIDALPIYEALSDLDYKSKIEGYMHACGHDGHTAMLMMACKWFNDHITQLDSDVYCIFQHAEELSPGGARAIMETGMLSELDFIYGQHLQPELDVGYVDIKAGPVTTNSDDYKIIINGVGGHSYKPSRAVNPINLASLIIQAINEIPSQAINSQESVVISNTYIQSGNLEALNIISDQLVLAGSVRTFDKEIADFIESRIYKIVEGVCAIHGASFQFTYNKGARAVINHTSSSHKVKKIAEEIKNNKVVSLKPAMFGEDFSAYSDKIPSTFVMMGSRSGEETSYPLHHPKFNIDESALMVGLKMLVAVVLNYK